MAVFIDCSRPTTVKEFVIVLAHKAGEVYCEFRPVGECESIKESFFVLV